MGHLNVQFYVDKVDQGLAALALALGLGPREIRERRLRLAAVDQHIRFLREQRAGAPFHVDAGVVDVSPEALGVYAEMRSSTSDEVAATFLSRLELRDARTDQIVPWPAVAVRAAEDHRVEVPAHAAPRGLRITPPRARPRLQEAAALGMVCTLQARVGEEQCDALGVLRARHFMGLVSDSIPQLLFAIAGTDRSAAGRVGGAALEYRFVVHAWPRAGDVLVLRSGLKALTEKTYSFAHWLFDLESGDAVATAEAVAIALDLETRRAVPLPAELREALTPQVRAALSA